MTFEHFCFVLFSLTLCLAEVGIYKRKNTLSLKIKEKKKENFFSFINFDFRTSAMKT